MFQNSRDIVTKRDIAMYIKVKENYVCCSWEGMYVVMEIDIVIAGGEGLVVWEIGSLMLEQCAVTI